MSLSTLHGMNEFTLSDFHDRSAGAEFIGYTINSNINVKLLNAWSPFHMFQYQFGWENTQQIHFVTLSQHGFFTNQLQHRHFLVDICGFFFLSIFVCVRWYLIYVRCQKIQRGSNIVCGEYIYFSIYIYIPNRTIFSSLRDDIQKKSRIKITLNYEYTRRKIFSSNGDDVNAPAVRQQLTRLVMIAKRWIKSKSDGEHIVPHSTRLITFSVFFCYQQFCCCFMSLPRKRAHWPR